MLLYCPRLLKRTVMRQPIIIDGQSEAIVPAQLAQGNARSSEELVEMVPHMDCSAYSRSMFSTFDLLDFPRAMSLLSTPASRLSITSP